MSENQNEIVIVTGAGAIGQAIARRVSAGKTILFADINKEAGDRAAASMKSIGFEAEAIEVDVSSRESVRAMAARAIELGSVVHLIHTAGLSPAQATPKAIIAVDLVGTAHVLEEVGEVIAPGGSGVVISSQAGHMIPPLSPEQNHALGQTPSDELDQLPFLQSSEVPNSGFAYALAKRANTLRVQAASVEWGDRGARLNSMSPGIIMTPLAQDEFNGPGGAGYREMVRVSAAGRVGTPDEVGAAGAFLLGRDAAFITGSDLLIDGGVIASIVTGRYELTMGGSSDE